MATATKARKAKDKAPEAPAAAATIGSGNPGDVAKLASAGQDLDSFLASQGVGEAAPKPAAKGGNTAPLARISATMDEQAPDGKVRHVNVIDAWVAATRAAKTAEANQKTAAALAYPLAEKLRQEISRRDSKFHSSIQVSGEKETAMFIARIAGATAPSERLPKAAIESALRHQFGDDWKNYVSVKRTLVVNPKLGVPDLQKIALALAEKGLLFGTLVVEDVQYVPTDALHEQQVLDPKVAAKAEALRSAGVLKNTVTYLKA
jgi:hypothetical protein